MKDDDIFDASSIYEQLEKQVDMKIDRRYVKPLGLNTPSPQEESRSQGGKKSSRKDPVLAELD